MSAVSFTDLHCHILPDLDDGPASVEQSVAMLQIAAAERTASIVATPHANGKYRFEPELIERRLEQLRPRTPITLHYGCDFHLETSNILAALADPARYTLNHRNHLLVEFPELNVFHVGEEILRRLIEAGLVPIISHPERNERLQRQPELLLHWVEMGCRVQVTAGSCLGVFGKDALAATETLLQRGLVHFVASDAHDAHHRPPGLSGAYARLSALFGEDGIRPLFVDNPEAAVQGNAIAPRHPALLRRSGRRFFQFWPSVA